LWSKKFLAPLPGSAFKTLSLIVIIFNLILFCFLFFLKKKKLIVFYFFIYFLIGTNCLIITVEKFKGDLSLEKSEGIIKSPGDIVLLCSILS
jgi:hypothetical protein